MELRDDWGEYVEADFEEDSQADAEMQYLAEVLRQSLHEDYADSGAEQMEEALVSVLDSMSPAESIHFANALSQIGSSAGHLMSDPRFAAVARTALPVAGAALGTAVGGPAGTALGGQLGTVATGALRKRQASAAHTAPPASPKIPDGEPRAANGSAAAAQGLVLTQQPQVLQSLLSAALGQHGRRQIGGIPVAQVLGMLSQVIGQAAADADEMAYLDGYDAAGSAGDDVAHIEGSLYTGLLDADNIDLTEAL